MRTAIEGENGGVYKVNAALIACMQTFGKHQQLAKIFLIQAVGLGTVFESKRHEIHSQFVQIIKNHLDEALEDGDIRQIDTQIAAYAWMGAINEVIIHWVLKRGTFPRSFPTSSPDYPAP